MENYQRRKTYLLYSRFNNEPVYKTEGILPKGPASNNFYNLFFHNGKLYATGGFYAQENDGNYPGEVQYGMEKTGLNLNNHLMMFLVIAT